MSGKNQAKNEPKKSVPIETEVKRLRPVDPFSARAIKASFDEQKKAISETKAEADAEAEEIRQKNIKFVKVQAPDIDWHPGLTLDSLECGAIVKALKFHQGNRTATAEALGIALRTLQNRILKYREMGIEIAAAPIGQPRDEEAASEEGAE